MSIDLEKLREALKDRDDGFTPWNEEKELFVAAARAYLEIQQREMSDLERYKTALYQIANGADDPMDIAHIALNHPDMEIPCEISEADEDNIYRKLESLPRKRTEDIKCSVCSGEPDTYTGCAKCGINGYYQFPVEIPHNERREMFMRVIRPYLRPPVRELVYPKSISPAEDREEFESFVRKDSYEGEDFLERDKLGNYTLNATKAAWAAWQAAIISHTLNSPWLSLGAVPDEVKVIAWLSSDKGFEDISASLYKNKGKWFWYESDQPVKRPDLIHGWKPWPTPPISKTDNEIEDGVSE